MFLIVVPYPFKLVIMQTKRPLALGKHSKRFGLLTGGQQIPPGECAGPFEKVTAGELKAGVA